MKTQAQATLALICTILLGTACVEQDEGDDAEAIVQRLVEEYESLGDLVFIDPAGQDAFQFTSPEAEARFHADLDARGLGFEQDMKFRNLVVNGIGTGSSSHTVDAAMGLVAWEFYTDNTSGKIQKAADVNATVYHPNGLTLTCKDDDNVSYNSCNIYTTLASGYNSAAATHRACHKKNVFSSWNCTPWFPTSDLL